MKLKTIKLAGFKSFVEPTTIQFDTNLTAIVGPNGCGKSNILEAVLFVIGALSARHLRAESMTEMIFNGTSNRQPLSQAAVELIFDNTEGRLGGQYASYTEISIRRVVARDGQSHYFLNNARCRRRDIVDLFLGTGLGPNSYAIISQGTINRFIEAKPEERSQLLQEAAGISRYPERRRDTESRIRQTRENIKRVKDLLEELEKQRKHLDKQAAAASRFKKLKKKERELKATLQAIHYRDLKLKSADEAQILSKEELALESKLADQSRLDKEIESLRLKQTESNDYFNEIQTRYYRLTSDIGRLEQRIQHHQERDKQIAEDMIQINRSIQEINKNVEEDTHQIDKLQNTIQQLEPDLKLAINVANESEARFQHEEQLMKDWQLTRDEFISQAAKSDQEVEVEQTRVNHLKEQASIIEQRQQRVEKNLSEITIDDWPKKIQQLHSETEQCQEALEKAQGVTDSLENRVTEQRQQLEDHNSRLADQREKLQDLRARQTSFLLIKKNTFVQNDHGLDEWLDQEGFATYPKLAQCITVAQGWEKAIEMVLGTLLQAVCLPKFEKDLSQKLQSLKEGALALYLADLLEEDELLRTRFGNKAVPLLEKIDTDLDLKMLLKYVYATRSTEEALALRGSLEAHESIVTQEGAWVGPTWVRLVATPSSSETKNIFECEKELNSLADEIPKAEKHFEQEEEVVYKIQETIADLEAEKKEARLAQSQLMNEYNDKRTELNTLKSQFNHLSQRKTTLELEAEENQIQLKDTHHLIKSAQATLDKAREQSQLNASKRQAFITERDQHQEKLDDVRRQARTDKEVVDDLSLRLESSRNQLHFLNQSMGRAKSQLVGLKERYTSLEDTKQSIENPIDPLKAELEAALESRLTIEFDLNKARTEVESITKNAHKLTVEHKNLLEVVQKIRSQLESIRLNQNSLQMRLSSYEEQITELGFDRQILLDALSESDTAEECERQLNRSADQIERLGPINLAAIADSEQLAERQNYLNSQNEDLESALEMLENAIEKIDNETRVRFKEAYEKVNAFFKELFPRIFAGGKGSLELNDSDLLTAGVVIKVQPPGKRNTTIHSLSGGEKALTAIALVFSFFQLNPAPFCILDEVDAPLDDVNVNRFCDLLKEMSDRIQFIFITHNKLAMEMAKQLMGVTMRELGVSRLVSVDIEAAMNLVEEKTAS